MTLAERAEAFNQALLALQARYGVYIVAGYEARAIGPALLIEPGLHTEPVPGWEAPPEPVQAELKLLDRGGELDALEDGETAT